MKKHEVHVFRVETEADRDRCLAIRETVFVHEQNVPLELEKDEYDLTAIHFLATVDTQALGTGRMRPKGPYLKFERIATLKASRGLGIGRALMDAMVQFGLTEYPNLLPMMHAQQDAIGFYEKVGWIAVGETFYEAGIPHRIMIYLSPSTVIADLAIWKENAAAAEILERLAPSVRRT